MIGPTDKETVTALILLDPPAAFDTVVHDTLLHILKNLFDLFGPIYTRLACVLPAPSYSIHINQFTLISAISNSAVPLGSVLYPLLLTQYAPLYSTHF